MALAEKYVYPGIEEHTLPTDEYVKTGTAIAEQQLAKAGYRLALALLNMWGPKADELAIGELE